MVTFFKNFNRKTTCNRFNWASNCSNRQMYLKGANLRMQMWNQRVFLTQILHIKLLNQKLSSFWTSLASSLVFTTSKADSFQVNKKNSKENWKTWIGWIPELEIDRTFFHERFFISKKIRTDSVNCADSGDTKILVIGMS